MMGKSSLAVEEWLATGIIMYQSSCTPPLLQNKNTSAE